VLSTCHRAAQSLGRGFAVVGDNDPGNQHRIEVLIEVQHTHWKEEREILRRIPAGFADHKRHTARTWLPHWKCLTNSHSFGKYPTRKSAELRLRHCQVVEVRCSRSQGRSIQPSLHSRISEGLASAYIYYRPYSGQWLETINSFTSIISFRITGNLLALIVPDLQLLDRQHEIVLPARACTT
jgi:hypothetical protein